MDANAVGTLLIALGIVALVAALALPLAVAARAEAES
jgi:hypothetical protein